jgi:protein TonB
MPVYPPFARARGQEGVVLLRAIVDREGRIEDGVTVVQSSPTFDDAAVAAFRRWRFQPGRDESGTAVRVILEVPIRFQLR